MVLDNKYFIKNTLSYAYIEIHSFEGFYDNKGYWILRI